MRFNGVACFARTNDPLSQYNQTWNRRNKRSGERESRALLEKRFPCNCSLSATVTYSSDFCGYGNCILERTERDGNKEAAAAAAPSVVQNDSPWSGISEWGRRLGCVIGSLLFPQPESELTRHGGVGIINFAASATLLRKSPRCVRAHLCASRHGRSRFGVIRHRTTTTMRNGANERWTE